MEEPGRLQSMGSLSQTQLSDFTFTFHFHALEKEMATHSSVLAWRRDRGVWWAAIYGVMQSWTRLKRLSSSSSSKPLYLVNNTAGFPMTSSSPGNPFLGREDVRPALHNPARPLTPLCWGCKNLVRKEITRRVLYTSLFPTKSKFSLLLLN